MGNGYQYISFSKLIGYGYGYLDIYGIKDGNGWGYNGTEGYGHYHLINGGSGMPFHMYGNIQIAYIII